MYACKFDAWNYWSDNIEKKNKKNVFLKKKRTSLKIDSMS